MRIALQLAQSGLIAILLVAPATLEARSFRANEVPNGDTFDCGLCHVSTNGGGARNDFGIQIQTDGLDGEGAVGAQSIVWSAICDRDADGDLFTNAEELGDPNCEWTIGDPNPSLTPSNPGDSDSIPCGNGRIDGPEECDGDDLGEETCETQMQSAGTLACAEDCSFDTSGCVDEEEEEEVPEEEEPEEEEPEEMPEEEEEDEQPETPDDTMAEEDNTPAEEVGAACDGELEVDQQAGTFGLLFFALLASSRRRFLR